MKEFSQHHIVYAPGDSAGSGEPPAKDERPKVVEKPVEKPQTATPTKAQTGNRRGTGVNARSIRKGATN